MTMSRTTRRRPAEVMQFLAEPGNRKFRRIAAAQDAEQAKPIDEQEPGRVLNETIIIAIDEYMAEVLVSADPVAMLRKGGLTATADLLEQQDGPGPPDPAR